MGVRAGVPVLLVAVVLLAGCGGAAPPPGGLSGRTLEVVAVWADEEQAAPDVGELLVADGEEAGPDEAVDGDGRDQRDDAAGRQ